MTELRKGRSATTALRLRELHKSLCVHDTLLNARSSAVRVMHDVPYFR
jgi:hypothetical protein